MRCSNFLRYGLSIAGAAHPSTSGLIVEVWPPRHSSGATAEHASNKAVFKHCKALAARVDNHLHVDVQSLRLAALWLWGCVLSVLSTWLAPGHITSPLAQMKYVQPRPVISNGNGLQISETAASNGVLISDC
jgi:hypothetical protein